MILVDLSLQTSFNRRFFLSRFFPVHSVHPLLSAGGHSVHLGINPPSKTLTPLSCQAPPRPPLYCFFVNPPPKSQIFQ